jgi:hypothetical protein
MVFVALANVEMNLFRAGIRKDDGGRNVSEAMIRQIHTSAMGRLPEALRTFHVVNVRDNSGRHEDPPRLVLRTTHGRITFDVGDARPAWLQQALARSGMRIQPSDRLFSSARRAQTRCAPPTRARRKGPETRVRPRARDRRSRGRAASALPRSLQGTRETEGPRPWPRRWPRTIEATAGAPEVVAIGLVCRRPCAHTPQ